MNPPLVNQDNLRPCYFFYGEEPFLAREFIERIKEIIVHKNSEDSSIEKFRLEDHSWAEIIDLARTVPFFSPQRLILVEVSDARKAKPSAAEQKLIADYFQNCSTQTVIVVVFSGKIRKSSPLVKYFSTLPSVAVSLEEMKPLKDWKLPPWIEKKFQGYGKIPDSDAVRRLAEIAGNNLNRIHNEIEKIVIYVGEKKQIELDDVNQISGWVKSFVEWEITENLEVGNYKQSLFVLDMLINKEKAVPVKIVGVFSRFFSNLLLAKLLLLEKKKDRKAIFKEFKPQILESFRDLYTRKFNSFFYLVDLLSLSDLNRFITKLEKIDLQIKTSSLSPQILLEGFLFEYCRFLGEESVILKGRR